MRELATAWSKQVLHESVGPFSSTNTSIWRIDELSYRHNIHAYHFPTGVTLRFAIVTSDAAARSSNVPSMVELA